MRSGQRKPGSEPAAVLMLVLVALAVIAGGLALDAARATVTGSGSRGTPRAGQAVVAGPGGSASAPRGRGPR